MTRKEEIKQSSLKYLDNFIPDIYGISEQDIYETFINGAYWADEHPKLSWINVEDDLPCNHSELISPNKSREGLTVTEYVVAAIYGYKVLSRMYELDGKWQWETDEPTHWFPIPEPPK